MEKFNLEVGDVIYGISGERVVHKLTIERCTKTKASSKGTNFNREQDDPNFIRAKGDTSWTSLIYKLETPELKQKYNISLITRYLNKVDWSTLSDDQIMSVYGIIKN